MTTKELLEETPIISADTYKKLPELLRECVEQFHETREKDVVLTSVLTIMSGCFSKFTGRYGVENVGPNLYAFIIAPPASGKGVMKYAKQLGQPIQDAFLKARNLEMIEYEKEKKKLGKDKQGIAGLAQPKCPVLFIPGNSSSAAVYSILSNSNGEAIMVETEADTVSNILMQDWGNFSDIFRKAFHHEGISMSRKTGSEYVEIANPHLSVLLSGTPSQVTKLITSAEDGLSSRFLYYTYAPNFEWKNPTPCKECPDFNTYFYGIGEKVAQIKKHLDSGKYSFDLSEVQYNQLSKFFESKAISLKESDSVTALSTLKRLGLICYRIAMILTVARRFEKKPRGWKVPCTQEDLDTAIELCSVYYDHSMAVLQMLPKHSKIVVKSKVEEFLDNLPKDKTFSRKEADEIGFNMKISKKSVGNYLTELCEKGLASNPMYGHYERSEIS